MDSGLPINIRDLLHLRGIESARVEFKKSWNQGPTAHQVSQSLCAFANDFQNINGGYLIIGVEAADGRAKLPPCGLDPADIEEIQRQIRVACKTRIDPEYQPLMSPEVVDGVHILVLWAPGSDNRPHRAAVSHQRGAERRYYIRVGSETCAAQGSQLTQLMQMTAKVPFDDRRAHEFQITDIRLGLVREFLHDVGSGLVDADTSDDVAALYRRMRITAPVNGHDAPRNVALLFFSDDPERAFPGARIEVAQFAGVDASGDMIAEKIFQGPLVHQLRRCIDYLRSVATSHIQKMDDRADAHAWASYPLPALEEVLVNALYHRSYDRTTPEPTKIYLYSDRIVVTSYPGPMPGLRPEDFAPGRDVPPVPARNRRIGEMLKELRLAEQRSSGIPKVYRAMRENGSPQPQFSFGESYFRVVLPAHLQSSLAGKSSTTQDGEIKRLVDQLQQAIRRKERLTGASAPTEDVIEEILSLKRQLRQGGQLREGDILNDRYLLMRKVGRGGFATVWEAIDQANHDRVAIKILHSELAGDLVRRQRFFRGARIMSELDHPAVVHIREPEAEDAGFYYFVMDYLAGGDLREAVLTGRVDRADAIPIILRIGEALAMAHQRGYVHRDVKPTNILLSATGEPFLTDFDLVAALDTTGGTRTGALGTFLYAAPEMLDRPQDADARADVYGLGMTAAFILHGAALPIHVMRDSATFIREFDCPAALAAVLERATDWEMKRRQRDAGAFCDALAAVMKT